MKSRVTEKMKEEIDLGLGLGVTNQGAGAGANAKLKSMPFPLTELVWCTQNGLTIKSATDENVGQMEKEKEDFILNSNTIPTATADLLPLFANETDLRKRGEEGCSKMEGTAENDVQDCMLEKQEEHDGSMESCNSGNLSLKKKKERRFEQELITGSKRIKKQTQDQECGAVKQDSSFMNWISNMVKGVKPDQEEVRQIDDDDDGKRLGFQRVFQSLYSQDPKTGSSKEIILFDKNKTASHDDTLNQKAFGNLWITRLSPKTRCFFCGNDSCDCLQKKVSIGSTSGVNNIPRISKGMFDTIRRLRLSRTDILKWMNSRLPLANLDGYYLRLRLAKWEEGVGEAGYYVACITDQNPSKASKKRIRINIGGVECLVESRYISNCDFLEEELIAWWRTTLKSGRVPMEDRLTSRLEERKNLGF